MLTPPGAGWPRDRRCFASSPSGLPSCTLRPARSPRRASEAARGPISFRYTLHRVVDIHALGGKPSPGSPRLLAVGQLVLGEEVEIDLHVGVGPVLQDVRLLFASKRLIQLVQPAPDFEAYLTREGNRGFPWLPGAFFWLLRQRQRLRQLFLITFSSFLPWLIRPSWAGTGCVSALRAGRPYAAGWLFALLPDRFAQVGVLNAAAPCCAPPRRCPAVPPSTRRTVHAANVLPR